MEAAGHKKTDVLVVGAGVAGLSCAIITKKHNPDFDVCVVEKSLTTGGHNASGTVLEILPLCELLNATVKDWQDAPIVKETIDTRAINQQAYMLSENRQRRITGILKTASKLHLSAIEPFGSGSRIVSLSKLTRLLAHIAKGLGVRILLGHNIDEIEFDGTNATSAKLLDDSVSDIDADFVVLAEGCGGFVTEKFISKSGMKRMQQPLHGVGIKEIIEVSPNQNKALGKGSFIRLSGYPFRRAFSSPSILGSGFIYPLGDKRMAVGAIVSLNWKYANFSPQDALALLKEHPFVANYVMGGQTIETSVKLIPQGGYYSIPADISTGSIGKGNVAIVGDGASFYNMRRLKGIDNAITSGMCAGLAIGKVSDKNIFASYYTNLLTQSGLLRDLKNCENYRRISSKAPVSLALAASRLSCILPFRQSAADSKSMTNTIYPYQPKQPIDKKVFVEKTAAVKLSGKPHIYIKDLDVCKWDCMRRFDCPCLKFCPAGVFGKVLEHIQPTAAESCLHCKLCRAKCPYENIIWTLPQPGSGPRYYFS